MYKKCNYFKLVLEQHLILYQPAITGMLSEEELEMLINLTYDLLDTEHNIERQLCCYIFH